MTQTNRFVVAETFGVKAPRGLTVEGFADPTHPQIPVKRPYVFREHLRDVLAFLADPAGDGLLLTGPTGAGKTSLVLQVAARLNWPVQEVTCHGRMELVRSDRSVHADPGRDPLRARPPVRGGAGRPPAGPERDGRHGRRRARRPQRHRRGGAPGDRRQRRRGDPPAPQVPGDRHRQQRRRGRYQRTLPGRAAPEPGLPGPLPGGAGVLPGRRDRAGADPDPGAEPPRGHRREDGGGGQRGPPALPGSGGHRPGADRDPVHPHPGALGTAGADLQGGAPAAGLHPGPGVDRPGRARAAGGDPPHRRRCLRRPVDGDRRRERLRALPLHPFGWNCQGVGVARGARAWAWRCAGAGRGASYRRRPIPLEPTPPGHAARPGQAAQGLPLRRLVPDRPIGATGRPARAGWTAARAEPHSRRHRDPPARLPFRASTSPRSRPGARTTGSELFQR